MLYKRGEKLGVLWYIGLMCGVMGFASITVLAQSAAGKAKVDRLVTAQQIESMFGELYFGTEDKQTGRYTEHGGTTGKLDWPSLAGMVGTLAIHGSLAPVSRRSRA